MRPAVLLCVLLGAATAFAEGPSFDCGNATTPIEELICNDAELIRLDGLLGTRYTARLAESDAVAKETTTTEQRAWLTARFERCKVPRKGPPLSLSQRWESAPCLAALYGERIVALGGDPALAAPSPRTSEPGFVHPLCLELAVGTDLSGDAPPPEPVPLAACNRGNRHRPIEITETGYLNAWDAEDGSQTSFAYRPIGALADGRRVAITSYWGGGSGIFSALVALSEPQPGQLAAKSVFTGGDRCTGGLDDASIVGDEAVEVSSRATAVDFVGAIDPNVPERVSGGLGFCAVCCVATLRHRVDLTNRKTPTLVSATLTDIPDETDSEVERCAFTIMRRAAPTLPATLDAAKARELVADIVAECGARKE
jgi:uncharacterized protein YecT (DUF1311 family)